MMLTGQFIEERQLTNNSYKTAFIDYDDLKKWYNIQTIKSLLLSVRDLEMSSFLLIATRKFSP